METMQNYTCYCTAEQTKRAHKLGAPISTDWKYNQDMAMSFPTDEDKQHFLDNGRCAYLYSTGKSNSDKYVFGHIPTTQQLIGWLRKKEIGIGIIVYKCAVCSYGFKVVNNNYSDSIIAASTIFDTYGEAELAAIDAALDYLERNL